MIELGYLFNIALMTLIYFLLYKFTGMGKWYRELGDTRGGWTSAIVCFYLIFTVLPLHTVKSLMTVYMYGIDEASMTYVVKSEVQLYVEYVYRHMVLHAIWAVGLSIPLIVFDIFGVQWPCHFIPNHKGNLAGIMWVLVVLPSWGLGAFFFFLPFIIKQ